MNIDKRIDNHLQNIKGLVSDNLAPIVEKPLTNLEVWLASYINLSQKHIEELEGFEDEEDSIRILLEHIRFRNDMLTALDEWIGDRISLSRKQCLGAFDDELFKFIKKLPKHWVTNQAEERFKPIPSDEFREKLIKLLKRLGFWFYSTPTRTGNLFRKIFKKSAKQTPRWKQRIPIRKLSSWYFGNHFLHKFIDIADEAYKQSALLANEMWKVDNELYEHINKFALNEINKEEFTQGWKDTHQKKLRSIKRKVTSQRTKLVKLLDEGLNSIDEHFVQQAKIGGTLEFKSFKHREAKRKRDLSKIKKRYTNQLNNRFNTLYILADDWKFNQEIYVLTTNAQKAGLHFKYRLQGKAEVVGEPLAKIPEFIAKIKESIELKDLDEFKKSIQLLKYNAGKILINGIIGEITDTLFKQDFPLIIDDAESKLLSDLGKMTQQRILVEGFDPSQAYPSKALGSISANQLIEFEMTDSVQKSVKTIKLEALETLEKIRLQLDELGRMVMFGLDTSLVILNEKGGDALPESIENAISGIERANSKYKDLSQNFSDFINSLQNNFGEAVNEFSQSLIELTNNSTVEKIRYRIAKAKAIRKGQLIIKHIKNIVPSVKHWVLKMRKLISIKSIKSIGYVKNKLGIQKIAKEISVEISEFLTKSDLSFKKLPFVYRRLFVNEPLKDQGFYHARTKESNTLKLSFEKWQTGNYMPVLIIGEKGSGISSFLDIFAQQQLAKSLIVKSVVLTERILTQEHLLKFLGESIRESAFTSPQDFVTYVQQQEPFVLILDRLQMLYLREPGGFKCFKHLFELISSTSRNIFWICTCGIYASSYLNKAVGLRGYFPSVVEMEKLDAKNIEHIIMLRHKTSGYYLKFNPSANDLASRAFTKLNEKQQQDHLHTKYFEQLNIFTKSNIAFALQLWIRSIDKIEENTCHLNSLDDVDFSFMMNLEQEVVFGLHNLLLHERLDATELASMLNIGIRQAKLLLMRLADRGIVTDKEGFYKIHPLLYRQTVQLLTDKNLIY
jgi:hypothetical protein